MNTLDKKYQQLLSDIIEFGVEKKDRTGTGTLSVFGRQIRHKMSEGFPLLTTKKMTFKTMVVELLWFLRGDTNIKFLLDYDCHIWTGDAYKRYVETHKKEWGDKMTPEQLEKSYPDVNEFENLIKTVPEFAKTWGELGPIYGKQWRSWTDETEHIDGVSYFKYGNIDQITNLINELKTNPDSRRLMVSAWNVGELDQMILPPCHYGFQVYTKELSVEERNEWFQINRNGNNPTMKSDWKDFELDQQNIPKRYISLMWNQRSVDTFLGLPFNIASYGLLLEIIAKEVNMIPDELIGNLGDTHLYSNHIEQAREQIGSDLTDEERYNKWFNNNYETGMEKFFDPNKLPDYENSYYEPTPKRTREPYRLPTIIITERNWYQHELVKEHLGPKTFSEKIMSYRPDCFELVGYKAHPKIKAHLNN